MSDIESLKSHHSENQLLQEPVLWPGVIKYLNEEELQFIQSATDWNAHCATMQVGDVLIDSAGVEYEYSVTGKALRSTRQCSVAEVLNLARQHASVCGQCCVSKMNAPDIATVVALIGRID